MRKGKKGSSNLCKGLLMTQSVSNLSRRFGTLESFWTSEVCASGKLGGFLVRKGPCYRQQCKVGEAGGD